MAVLSNTGIRAGASAAGGGGYQIEKSIRFNEPDDAKLSRTFTAAGDQTKFTLSFWFKNCDAGNSNSKMLFCLDNGGSSQLELYDGRLATQFYAPNGSDWAVIVSTASTHRFRDPSAWYHIVLSIDTTAGTTNADRQKIYINGEQLTLTFDTYWGGLMTGDVKGWNTAAEHFIGMRGSSYGGNWLAAEYYFIDGQALSASDFGETDATTGQWVAKEYAGTYGPKVDQSQTWSGSVTNPSGAYGVAANAFDGDVTTHASPNYSNPMTYTNASPSDTVIQTFEIKCACFATGWVVELNDTAITSQLTTTDQWHTITGFTGEQFEKLYWRPSVENYEVRIKAIRINGKILVDDTVTVNDNSFYLKFNGTDIGEDSSGNDNDWTATNLTPAGTTFDVPCVSFDGTDDYLEIADHADLGFGGGDFTVECFVRPETPGSDSYHDIAGSYQSSAGSYNVSSWRMTCYSKTDGTSNVMFYFFHGANQNYANSNYILPHGKWSHVVGTRQGDDLRIYVDGVQQSSIDISSYADMNDSSAAVRIGSDVSGNNDMKGAISNLRVVKGTCLYPDGTTFTVPSRPLANVTNTKLLCCQSSTQASAATVAHTVSGSINDGTSWSDLVEGTINSQYSSSDRSVPFNGTAWGSSLANTIRPNAGNLLEMDFGTRFNSATSVKITGQASLDGTTYSGTNENLEINGTALTASEWEDNGGGGAGAAGSATFSLSSGLQKIGWGYDYGSQSSGYLYLAAIEVDGVELKNPLLPRGSLGEFEAGSTLSDDTTDDDVTNDTPTDFDDGGNGTGNYATWNPLRSLSTFKQGNLDVTSHSSGTYNTTATTLGMTSGKWYCEMTPSATGGTNNAYGIINESTATNTYLGATTGTDSSMGLWDNGGTYRNSAYTNASYCSAFQTGGETIGIALDVDNGTLKFYIDGVDKGNAWTDIPAGTWHFCVTTYQTTTTHITLNCGQRAFKYTPPTGYKALNTYNLPDPTIADPSKYFDTKLYTGTGASHDITGLNFSPDFVWIKKYTSASHAVFDTIRGATYRLKTDSTAAVDWDNTTLSAFGTEGFTLSTNHDVNQNTDSYVAWNWDAGTANTSVSAGDLNSYNQTEVWSDDVSGTSNSGVYTGLFDGTLTGYEVGGDNQTLTYTPDGGISASSSIRIYLNQSSGTYASAADITVNGSSVKSAIGSAMGTGSVQGWFDIGTTSLTTLTWSNPSGGNNDYRLMAIEVDGAILVDTGVTPPNVPSIASTYRANPDAGFSIVTYTGNAVSGASIAHGLNAKPDFGIFKARETAGYTWYVYHKDLGNTHHLYLDGDYAKNDDSGAWNDTDPDSNVMTLGNTGQVNASGEDTVAYIWSEVSGYSKFGTYEGTELSDPDAAFIYCGFRPAWIMAKNVDATEDWFIWDNKRNGYNPTYQYLEAHDTDAENDTTNDAVIDIVSNGFKIRVQYAPNNANTYVFAAFAASPFKYSNAR